MIVAAAGVDVIVDAAADEGVVAGMADHRAGFAGLIGDAIVSSERFDPESLDVALVERSRLPVEDRLHFRAVELHDDRVGFARADDAERAVAAKRREIAGEKSARFKLLGD